MFEDLDNTGNFQYCWGPKLFSDLIFMLNWTCVCFDFLYTGDPFNGKWKLSLGSFCLFNVEDVYAFSVSYTVNASVMVK